MVAMEMNFSGQAPYTVALSTSDTITADTDIYTHDMMIAEAGMVHLLSVTDDNGCTVYQPDSMMANVQQVPEFEMAADTSICHNHVITLDASADNAESYLWTPGDITTPEITIDSTGVGIGTITYTVAATAANGCETEKSIEVTFEDCTGIPEQEDGLGIAVFPNPSDGSFKLTMQTNTPQKASIQIIDQNGKEVYGQEEITVNGKLTRDMDLNQLAGGVYFLKIISEDDLYTRKIIINR